MDRRQLDLTTLDAVVEDIKQLHEHGYEKTGDWDLSQVCQHVALTMSMSTEGAKFKVNPIIRMMATLMMKKKFFSKRSIAAGLAAPKPLCPALSDEAEAIQQFEQAVERFNAHQGDYHRHPLFGKLSRQQWHDFNTIHASHHLSFLIPNNS